MTAQARHIVFRTTKPDATDADIERWAAERGCIVANIRQIGADAEIEFNGKTVRPSVDCFIWTADIVLSEGIE
jgi:hypothetical protein